jgi:hypothetical protein
MRQLHPDTQIDRILQPNFERNIRTVEMLFICSSVVTVAPFDICRPEWGELSLAIGSEEAINGRYRNHQMQKG